MSVAVLETRPQIHMVNPEFDALVQRIIEEVKEEQFQSMREDFHNRLRIASTPPDDEELVSYLWDFFFDWCVFEHNLPEKLSKLTAEEVEIWKHVKEANQHGLYQVQKASEDSLKLKDLFNGKTFIVERNDRGNFVGISRGDFIEGRLVEDDHGTEKKSGVFRFARRPSYHPSEVHPYIKTKIKSFKKAKDFSTYQNWLWMLVAMYLKHRIYKHMPIEKIYDDNSRI